MINPTLDTPVEANVPVFLTADLHGLHVRCPSCRRHRPGSDFLRMSKVCQRLRRRRLRSGAGGAC